MERKLASIQSVVSVEPIEGADFIEKIKVLGWTLIAKKGEFRPGDKCVYFEIDSILPDIPMFSFIKGKGLNPMRLRTKKMRGVISQGLAMPVNIINEFLFGNGYGAEAIDCNRPIGDDVTDLLGVTKYEPPVIGKSASRGYWPPYLPKTDEIRVQSAPDALEEMQGLPVYISIKLDGCSCTFSYRDGEFEVCSRNFALKDTSDNPDFKDDRWWQMARQLNMKERLEGYCKGRGNFAIQGELCGPGIQGNKLALAKNKFFVFNVYDIDNQKYLNFDDFIECVKQLGLEAVPILSSYTTCNFTQEALLALAEGKYDDTSNEREGIVIRPVIETYSKSLRGRLSLKAISNQFLLKGGD